MDAEKIVEFAMQRAGLTEGNRKDCWTHPFACECEKCKRFYVYLRIKEMIEDWERFQAKADRVDEAAKENPELKTQVSHHSRFDLLDVSLTTIDSYNGLGTKIRKAAIDMNVRTLRELIAHTEEDFLRARNFGPCTLGRLNAWVASMGFKLRTQAVEDLQS